MRSVATSDPRSVGALAVAHGSSSFQAISVEQAQPIPVAPNLEGRFIAIFSLVSTRDFIDDLGNVNTWLAGILPSVIGAGFYDFCEYVFAE